MPSDSTFSPPNPYDVVPYESHPFQQTHPARLATIAKLFSLPAPSPETARVLEIGCAAGGNIIPLAYAYPQAQFIAVDNSRVQIDSGRRLINALGLQNIELRHADLSDINKSWGVFDFILCHGVYSWVSPPLQDKILSVVGELLSTHGIAYVSYNAYPGWHLRGIVRQMMRYHALRYLNPHRRIAEARRILDVVAKHAGGEKGSPYSQLLKQEAAGLAKSGDYYIFHEQLEDECNPIYFHEFIGRAREYDLDYLGEAQLSSMVPANFGSDAQEALKSLARDEIELEQFMDYFRNRTFRETLLHRAGSKPNYELQPELLQPMFLSGCGLVKEPPIVLTKGVTTNFLSRTGNPVTTPMPLLKAAIVELTEHWPLAVPFDALLAASCRRLSVETTDLEKTMLGRALLLVLTTSDLIEASLEPSRFTISPSERPVASALAREQTKQGLLVTTCRHEIAQLKQTELPAFQALDGTNSVSDLAKLTRVSKDTVAVQIERFSRLALIVR